MSLVSRALEQAGIPTVIIGSALDIVEHCGVARYLFVDFPLGNPCGRPYDKAMQANILAQALDLLEHATQPGRTVATDYVWDESGRWREQYMHIGPDNIAELRAAGERRRAEQAASKVQA